MTLLDGRPANILLVDDDPGDQELTRRAMESGRIINKLFIVNDGEEALDFLYHKGKYSDPQSVPLPDLILLDLNMPKIDGKKVLQKIKSDPELKRIVVVVLSTSQLEQDIIKSYELGANSFITKPVDMDEFVSSIEILKDYWLQLVKLSP